jgi:hypothetical protein
MRRLAFVLLPLALLVARVHADDEKKLAFETPKEWKEQPAKTTPMAPIHEWNLEKAEGDAEEPVVKLFHWPSAPGDADANVKRWTGMFKTKDGEALPADKVKKETFESNGLKFTTVELEGTYKDKKDQKSIAVYIKGSGDDVWTVRLDGPIKSVDKAKDAFLKWLKSAKVSEK